MKKQPLEIFSDASSRSFSEEQQFQCAAAYNINTNQFCPIISSNMSNNAGELFAVYLALRMADVIMEELGEKRQVIIYSDSQFCVYGLTKWLDHWVEGEKNGFWVGAKKKRIKNQGLFKLIIKFVEEKKMKVSFLHCKAHVSLDQDEELQKASDVFWQSNGFRLPEDEIIRIAYHNNYVDQKSRDILLKIDMEQYPAKEQEDYIDFLRGFLPTTYRDCLMVSAG